MLTWLNDNIEKGIINKIRYFATIFFVPDTKSDKRLYISVAFS